MKVKNLSVFLFAGAASKKERASGLLQEFQQSCDGFDPASASRSEDFLEKKKKKQRLNLMGEKIVGGTQVPTDNTWTWLASLSGRCVGYDGPDCDGNFVENDAGKGAGHRCGGSLIFGGQYFLTAAHCVDSTLATLGIKIDKFLFENNEILFGSNNLNSASSSRIAAAVVHKDFDQMTLMHDIALVKLETAHILPTEDEVCIPENNWDIDTDFPFASEAFVAGYGVTSFGGFDKQTQLREVRVPLVDDITCENKYDNLGFGNVVMLDDATVCAGFPDGLNQDDDEADSCQGDSGGPLVQFDEDHGYHQVGIVSWGFGCASTYGIYTQVGNYVDWLKSAKESLDNCSSSSDCLDQAKIDSTKPKPKPTQPTVSIQVTQPPSSSGVICKLKKGRTEPLRNGCRDCKEMKKNKCSGNPGDPLTCNRVAVHSSCKSCKLFKKGKCVGSPCRLSSGVRPLPAGCKNCKMLKKNKC